MSICKGNKCIAGAGHSPTLTIRPTDKHWLLDGQDTGIVAEGNSASIRIGSVQQGQEASVTNSGTSNDAVLDFVLPKGENASVRVGTVSKGESASVTNSGTDQNAILNFTLPQGDKGEKGEKGESGSNNYTDLTNAPKINANNTVTNYQTNIQAGQVRNIYFSNTAPSASDGVNGDIWVVYEE